MTTMENIRDGNKEECTFEERYQELEEKTKQEAAATKIKSETK